MRVQSRLRLAAARRQWWRPLPRQQRARSARGLTGHWRQQTLATARSRAGHPRLCRARPAGLPAQRLLQGRALAELLAVTAAATLLSSVGWQFVGLHMQFPRLPALLACVCVDACTQCSCQYALPCCHVRAHAGVAVVSPRELQSLSASDAPAPLLEPAAAAAGAAALLGQPDGGGGGGDAAGVALLSDRAHRNASQALPALRDSIMHLVSRFAACSACCLCIMLHDRCALFASRLKHSRACFCAAQHTGWRASVRGAAHADGHGSRGARRRSASSRRRQRARRHRRQPPQLARRAAGCERTAIAGGAAGVGAAHSVGSCQGCCRAAAAVPARLPGRTGCWR